jgi:penicillin-binding protein 2
MTAPKMDKPRTARASLMVAMVASLAVGIGARSEEDEPVNGGEMISAAPAFESVPLVQYQRIEHGPTPMTSLADWRLETFRVPAPRSVVVSAEGTVLARNRLGQRLLLRLGESARTPDEAIARVRILKDQFPEGFPLLSLSNEEIKRHFENRAWTPLAVSGPIPEAELADLAENESALPDDCELGPLYIREYPEKDLAAHLIGYIGVALPDQRGPFGKVEYLWPPTEGRAGMEKTLDESLRGEDGELLRLIDPQGTVRHQEVVREAKPGDTVVLTLHMGMQQLAREQLARSGRPGAFVAVDADTGDILAMVSYPSFDPNLFEGGISQETYTALAESKEAPLFDRAVTGAYPPGSTFKPFVALAGMRVGHIRGTQTLFPGPAGMMIAGRYFRNHSSSSEGLMDVRYALVRSCNTWFYQAALNMGAKPISDMSARFGLGIAPELPLPSIAPGNIPEPKTYNDPRSLANYAIGQGRVLVSPVQMALAMAGLANGAYVPRPRLVRETVDARSGESIRYIEPSVAHSLGLRPDDVEIVRDGLWGVVNHGAGTAGGASMRNPVVYGKTGTSQWSSGGSMKSLAWFAGWVDAERPRIAFAAVTHGKGRETLSGGRSAAPIAAGVLRTVYREPETYAVTLPEGPSRQVSAIVAAAPAPQEILVEDTATGRQRNTVSGPRGVLRLLFGGGRRGRGGPGEGGFAP